MPKLQLDKNVFDAAKKPNTKRNNSIKFKEKWFYIFCTQPNKPLLSSNLKKQVLN